MIEIIKKDFVNPTRYFVELHKGDHFVNDIWLIRKGELTPDFCFIKMSSREAISYDGIVVYDISPNMEVKKIARVTVEVY